MNWEENCKKLISLLDELDINQKIMIAELNRNLGNFENFIRIIQDIDSNGLNWLKETLIKECERKNQLVIEFDEQE